MKNMPGVPHKTVISALRDAVAELRVRRRWSREAMADEIVTVYYRDGWDVVVGIDFQDTKPGARDVARALETNADRIWRWLDDQTKSSTLLPLNLFPVVLAVLPADLRLRVLSEVLLPIGIEVSLPVTGELLADHTELTAAAAKESGEGIAAFARLAGPSTAAELRAAEVELVESLEANSAALTFVRQRLSSGV